MPSRAFVGEIQNGVLEKNRTSEGICASSVIMQIYFTVPIVIVTAP